MHPKHAISGLILAVAAASSAQAQVTIDVSKITCDNMYILKSLHRTTLLPGSVVITTRSAITGLSTLTICRTT